MGQSNDMKAVELTGIVDDRGFLSVKEKILSLGSGKVRVIILSPEGDDIGEADWLKSATSNAAFDFLKDTAEDIYSLKDGKKFQHPV